MQISASNDIECYKRDMSTIWLDQWKIDITPIFLNISDDNDDHKLILCFYDVIMVPNKICIPEYHISLPMYSEMVELIDTDTNCHHSNISIFQPTPTEIVLFSFANSNDTQGKIMHLP